VVGDLLSDVIARIEQELRRGTDTPATIAHTRGGSGANVAVAAARSDVQVRFGGQVGDDDRGERLIAELVAAGIDVRVTRGGVTGTVVAVVDHSGERSFLTQRGAATQFMGTDDLLDAVDWLHVPGYSFEAGQLAETCHRVMGTAVQRSLRRSVSTGSLSLLHDYGRTEFLELIDAIAPEVVVANEPEATFLGVGDQPFPNTTWSVITRGQRPTLLLHADGDRREIPVPSTLVVDTTGAGDAFTGAFIAHLLHGGSAIDGVAAGHEHAARSLAVYGASAEERT
jgi:sugar/nucleoside kinase (ribokinase family)